MFKILLFALILFVSSGQASEKLHPNLQWALDHIRTSPEEDYVANQSIRLAEVVASQGNRALGIELLDQANFVLQQKLNRIGSTWPILPNLVLSYLRFNEKEKALQILDGLKDPEQLKKARLNLVRYFLLRGEYQQAMAQVEESSQIRFKIRGVGLIARNVKTIDGQEELFASCKAILYAYSMILLSCL